MTTQMHSYATEYNTALGRGVIIQLSLGIVTALVLDFGLLHRAFLIAILCQCAVVVTSLFRRPKNPTKMDLLLVSYGILPLFLVVAWFR